MLDYGFQNQNDQLTIDLYQWYFLWFPVIPNGRVISCELGWENEFFDKFKVSVLLTFIFLHKDRYGE